MTYWIFLVLFIFFAGYMIYQIVNYIENKEEKQREKDLLDEIERVDFAKREKEMKTFQRDFDKFSSEIEEKIIDYKKKSKNNNKITDL